jgi:hypothetical protein
MTCIMTYSTVYVFANTVRVRMIAPAPVEVATRVMAVIVVQMRMGTACSDG